MGPRERGRVAVKSPLALQPVPVSHPHFGRDLCCFGTGFLAACLFILWCLLD